MRLHEAKCVFGIVCIHMSSWIMYYANSILRYAWINSLISWLVPGKMTPNKAQCVLVLSKLAYMLTNSHKLILGRGGGGWLGGVLVKCRSTIFSAIGLHSTSKFCQKFTSLESLLTKYIKFWINYNTKQGISTIFTKVRFFSSTNLHIF